MLIESLTLPLCACVESDMSRRKKKKKSKNWQGLYIFGRPADSPGRRLAANPPKMDIITYIHFAQQSYRPVKKCKPNYVCMQDGHIGRYSSRRKNRLHSGTSSIQFGLLDSCISVKLCVTTVCHAGDELPPSVFFMCHRSTAAIS